MIEEVVEALAILGYIPEGISLAGIVEEVAIVLGSGEIEQEAS